jgi:hypothetical protein
VHSTLALVGAHWPALQLSFVAHPAALRHPFTQAPAVQMRPN